MATAQTTITEAMYTPAQLQAMQAQADMAVRRNGFEDFANQILMGAARGPTQAAAPTQVAGGNPTQSGYTPPPTAIAGAAPAGSYTGPTQGSIGSLLSSMHIPQAPAGANPNPVDAPQGGGMDWGGIGRMLAEYADEAAGVATTVATGNPLFGSIARRGVDGIKNMIAGTPAEEAPITNSSDGSGEPLFVDYGDGSTSMTAEELAAYTPPPAEDPRVRASQLAQDSLYGTANVYDQMGSVHEATLGAGSGGQNVGNAYSGSANSAASAAENWLKNQYGFTANDPNYDSILNHLVPWLMEQSSGGIDFAAALNTVSPTEIQRRIQAAMRNRNTA